jgi:alcohol dehydrogenase
VPTTAGTGSEVTPYSTVWDYGSRKKYSLSGPAVYAYAAVVDPALTDELPKEVTLTTGLDAINQALESVWNRNATSLTISIAARALQLGLQSLPSLQMDGGNSVDRDNMAECSLLAGLAISQTRTALCHSISYPLTSHFNVPHGLACAFTMPPVFRLNRSFDDTRFKQLACCMGCQDIDELDESVDRLVKELKVVERVRGFIPSMEKLRDLSSEMYTPGRADNNLAPVDENVITRILDCAYNDDRCW